MERGEMSIEGGRKHFPPDFLEFAIHVFFFAFTLVDLLLNNLSEDIVGVKVLQTETSLDAPECLLHHAPPNPLPSHCSLFTSSTLCNGALRI